MALSLVFVFIVKLFFTVNLFTAYTHGVILVSPYSAKIVVNQNDNVLSYTSMLPGVKYRGNGTNSLELFCQQNATKSIFSMFRSAKVIFSDVPKNYKLYTGENVTLVYHQFQSATVWNPTAWMSWQGTKVQFPAFGQYCLGVVAREDYRLQLVVKTVNYWQIIQLVLGLLFFYNARSISRNSIFHFTTGISVGVLASALILLYFLTKFIPKKSAALTFMVVSSSLVLYYLQLLVFSLQYVIVEYSTFILAYTVIAAICSFLFCYRVGPVTDKRTLNIIQWGIQLLSVLMIFFCTEYREVSTAMIMVMMGWYLVPQRWVMWLKVIWYRKFPPRIKLLTETEYIEQGTRETAKALEDLREYCNSPESEPWTTVLRLKDPIRFAKFVKGESSHLTDEEILTYDTEPTDEIERSLNDICGDGDESDSGYRVRNNSTNHSQNHRHELGHSSSLFQNNVSNRTMFNS